LRDFLPSTERFQPPHIGREICIRAACAVWMERAAAMIAASTTRSTRGLTAIFFLGLDRFGLLGKPHGKHTLLEARP